MEDSGEIKRNAITKTDNYFTILLLNYFTENWQLTTDYWKLTTFGKMPEWSIGAVSKTVNPLRGSRVRIPVFPQYRGNMVKVSHLPQFF